MNAQQAHYENKLAYEIDAWDLQQALAQSGTAGAPVLILVDTRSPQAYQEEHLPGAINLPHRTMDATSTAHLNREAQIVTYCDGIGCNASTKGALKLVRLGFHVKELIGGLDWWKRDAHPTVGTRAGHNLTGSGEG